MRLLSNNPRKLVGLEGYGLSVVEWLPLEIAPGEFFTLLGPSGCGKTTTLRMLLGLVMPTGGSATIGGEPYSEIRTPQRVVGAALEATNAAILRLTEGVPGTHELALNASEFVMEGSKELLRQLALPLLALWLATGLATRLLAARLRRAAAAGDAVADADPGAVEDVRSDAARGG